MKYERKKVAKETWQISTKQITVSLDIWNKARKCVLVDIVACVYGSLQ